MFTYFKYYDVLTRLKQHYNRQKYLIRYGISFLRKTDKFIWRNRIVNWHMEFKRYKINFIVIICIWIQRFSGTA